VWAYGNSTYPASSWAEWIYTAPGQTTFIPRAEFSKMWHDPRGSADTKVTTAIWGRNGWFTGLQSYPYPFDYGYSTVRWGDNVAGANQLNGFQAVFALELPSSIYRPGYINAYAGGAIIFLDDPDAPSVPSVSGGPPTDRWVDSIQGTANVDAHDPGLGVKYWNFWHPGRATDHRNRGCVGDRESPCGATYPQSFGWNTGVMPDGINRVGWAAYDPVYHERYSAPYDVKVDHTKPALSAPSGTLWNARNRTDDHRFEGAYGDSYTLGATATDAHAGVRDVEVFMTRAGGTRESQRARGGYSTGGTLNWTMRPDNYADGDYTVEIVARDHVQGQAGAPDERHVDVQRFTVTIDRRGDVYTARERDGEEPNDGYPVLATERAQLNTATAAKTPARPRRGTTCPARTTRADVAGRSAPP
jgi:hypothetical protein